MLDEHPWKDKNSSRAVRVMKPFWSYHWIEEPFLQQHQDWEDGDDGGLVIGKYDSDDDMIGDTNQSAITG